MSLNKFGTGSRGNYVSEYVLVRIVERILRQNAFIKTEKDGNVDLKKGKIINLRQPEDGNDAVNKKFVDEALKSCVRVTENEYGEECIDLRGKRIVNAGEAEEEKDVLTFKYFIDTLNQVVPRHLKQISSILTLRLECNEKEEFFRILPWNTINYKFPFDAEIKKSQSTFNDLQVETRFNAGKTYEILDLDNFCHVAKDGKLHFRKLTQLENPQFLELVVRSSF